MRRVNLDAIAGETTGDPIQAEVAGRTFLVRPDLPWNTSALWAADKLDEAIATLTVDTAEGVDFAAALVLRDNPTKVTAAARVNALLAAPEGEDLVGEAPASSDA